MRVARRRQARAHQRDGLGVVQRESRPRKEAPDTDRREAGRGERLEHDVSRILRARIADGPREAEPRVRYRAIHHDEKRPPACRVSGAGACGSATCASTRPSSIAMNGPPTASIASAPANLRLVSRRMFRDSRATRLARSRWSQGRPLEMCARRDRVRERETADLAAHALHRGQHLAQPHVRSLLQLKTCESRLATRR